MGEQSIVMVAEGHEIIREAIVDRIRKNCEDCQVVEAVDGYGAIKIARKLNPDVALLDLSLVRPSGEETLAKIRKSSPRTRVIVLSSEVDMHRAFFVLSQGAMGFMPKQAKGGDFVNAVAAALAGYSHLPIEFTKSFVQSRRNIGRTGNVYGLSPREMEILEACVRGENTKQISSNLNISVRTVETHRNNIYKKTGCNSLAELVRSASTWLMGDDDLQALTI